jgi:hypothetical protein
MKWLRFCALWGLLSVLAFIPSATNFLFNRYQVSVQDVLLPLIIAVLTALVVAATWYRLVQKDRLAGLVAGTLATAILASNFDARLTDITPIFQALSPIGLAGLEGTIFSVVLAALVLWLAGWAGRLVSRFVGRRHWKSQDIGSGIIVAVLATGVIQILVLAGNLIQEWPQFFYHPPKLTSAPQTAKAGSKPDIYYIVLEDYANKEVMQKQFSFDNSNFLDFLKDNHFNVNNGATVNYPYTAMSVASTMDANYLNDIVKRFGKASKQTVVPFNETIRQSPVAHALKAAGYSYMLVGNWYEGFNLSPVANHTDVGNGVLTVLGHQFVLNNFPKYKLTQSLFGRLAAIGIHLGKFTAFGYANLGDVDLVHHQLDKLQQLAAEPAGGRFIAADILVPHEAPFYFNANGSISANINEDNVGEPLRKKYTNEVQYINGQMKALLQKIDEQSHGQAAVILLSDEGPQLLNVQGQADDQIGTSDELQTGNMSNWSLDNLKLKYGTLSAVKLPGVDSSAVTSDTASSVNIFRLVLNSYLGYQLPYLPNCYYAYPDGRNYPARFTDITKRLSPEPEDARCQANGTVKQ